MENKSIGEVASRAGVSTSAIRYYERVGVLPESQRVNGRRRYSEDVLTRLAMMHMAQEAGFTISDIRTLFDGFEPGTAASARWRVLAEHKLDEIDAQIARAQTMKRILHESLECDCLFLDECGAIGWTTA